MRLLSRFLILFLALLLAVTLLSFMVWSPYGTPEPRPEPENPPIPQIEREPVRDRDKPPEQESFVPTPRLFKFDSEMPLGMVPIAATTAQTVGIDERVLMHYFTKSLKSTLLKKKGWESTWKDVFLFSTPEHAVAVPDFWIGKYEVTNAQWAVFFNTPANLHQDLVTTDRLRLGDMAADYYDVTSGPQFQRAWLYLLELNPHFMEHLNKDKDEKWDPLVAEAYKLELPAGLKINATRYLPPYGWTGSRPPESDLKLPVRGVSWQAATDFCEWAGLHLPHEHEFERAVRRDDGRLFPWGESWVPTYALWSGFNKATRAAAAQRDAWMAETDEKSKAALAALHVPEAVGNINNQPGTPVDVDSRNFEKGATPDGIMHLIGNVSEWTSGQAFTYPGSKTTFKFDNISLIARGGNYQDIAEVLPASDRIWDGPGSYLTPSMELEGFGFRLAGYPQPGRDLTAIVNGRYTLGNTKMGPPHWFPTPPRLGKSATKRAERRKFQGFNVGGTAGWIERQVARGQVANHVYVTGPARGLALLPIRGLPPNAVSKAKDIAKLASDPNEVFLLGLLVGTPNVTIELLEPPIAPKNEGDEPPARKTFQFQFNDERMYWAENDFPGARKDNTGLLLVLRDAEVLVYLANPGDVGNPQNYLKNSSKMLGALPRAYVPSWEQAVKPKCVQKYGQSVFTVSIPTLDKRGNLPKQEQKQAVITIHVPTH